MSKSAFIPAGQTAQRSEAKRGWRPTSRRPQKVAEGVHNAFDFRGRSDKPAELVDIFIFMVREARKSKPPNSR